MIAVTVSAAPPPLPEVVVNSAAVTHVAGATRTARPLAIHRKLPAYAPSPLVESSSIASRLGVRRVWVKDESWRLGLPSFKILGASYAIYCALIDRLGHEITWSSVEDLKTAIDPLRPITFVAATDGNHGRAVARMAKLLQCPAKIYVPEGTIPARISAIKSEGAVVEIVRGDYDAAIRRSAQDEDEHTLVISDTSWPGYTSIPRRVIEGYSTIFFEASEQLAGHGSPEPSLIVVPVGVGALAAAVINYYKPELGDGVRPIVIGVEPVTANCVQSSIREGRLVTVPGPHHSIMAGLNCGTPSAVAWPFVSQGLDVVVAIDDEWSRRAMRELADIGVISGESGAASLGGLLALCDHRAPTAWRERLHLDENAVILLLSTEGATDPEGWARIVGRSVPVHEEAVGVKPGS